MKSLGHKRGGGNVNLRGKKHKALPCRCCDMWDRREEILRRIVRQEIRGMLPPVRDDITRD